MRSAGPRLAGGLLALVPAVALAAGCGGSPTEDYCAVVEDVGPGLAAAAEDGGATGLLAVEEELGRLAEAAPRDITDEWDEITGRLAGLREALDEAGVDPAAYDPEAPVEGLDADERDAVEAAARALVDPVTVRAVADVEQQARDVCGTPLGL